MKEPTPLGDLLEGLLSRLGVADPDGAVTLMEQWADIAPSPWSERAAPLAVREGALEVEVTDGATASLLRYQVRQLVAHLDERLGSGLVTDVKIVVSRDAETS